jgi:hypothetical protein
VSYVDELIQRLAGFDGKSEAALVEPLDTLEEFFRTAGLPQPYVPAELAPQVQVLSEGQFGTRPGPSPYFCDWYLRELQSQQPAEYLLAGHAGYGANSWAVNYYLVTDHAALLLQYFWGGAFVDGVAAVDRISQAFARVPQLLSAVAAARRSGRLGADERLLVAAADTLPEGHGWAIQRATLWPEPNEWQRTADAPRRALEWLRGT